MVERYGTVVFYGDIQTPAVKAQSSFYPVGAWIGYTGADVNTLVDTGVYNEPGLSRNSSQATMLKRTHVRFVRRRGSRNRWHIRPRRRKPTRYGLHGHGCCDGR